MMKKKPKEPTSGTRVLGVDPGYERVGVAVVEQDEKGKETLLYSNCIRTDKKLPHSKRLAMIAIELQRVILEYKPKMFAAETLFFNVNQKTALLVAEARGVIITSASLQNIPVYEYTPLQIKMATTGDGRADKKQMMAMIPRLIKLNEKKLIDDEYDAIAVALTCLASTKGR